MHVYIFACIFMDLIKTYLSGFGKLIVNQFDVLCCPKIKAGQQRRFVFRVFFCLKITVKSMINSVESDLKKFSCWECLFPVYHPTQIVS